LSSCLEKMLAGKGQFVTVVGEAGLGKGDGSLSRSDYLCAHEVAPPAW